MNWISVKDELPDQYEEVVVWIKFDDYDDFCWCNAWIDKKKATMPFDYTEPNSNVVWQMSSAENYEITHWMRIEEPG